MPTIMPRSIVRPVLMVALMTVFPARADDAMIRPPAKGERIVFLGDSITQSDAGKVLRHVVLFKFKDGSTPADVEKIVSAFRALPGKIPQIKAFEWGTDVSPEGKSQGFTHCFLVTFAAEADRDAYLPHPAHQEFVSIVKSHVDKVCVVDFWSAP
ncbi:MAG: Dabb family protein [Planctomycetaceae bacterium]